MKRNGIYFWIGAALFLAGALLMTQVIGNQYPFFAGYVILQFIVLAVAWSILGGYAGYVNFGTSAFFGMGVYTAVFLFKAIGAPLAVQIAAAAAVGALMGFALGLLTLRMQGIFFSIATIALTIIIETVDHELALCRRRGRHPAAAAAGDGAVRQLCADAVLRPGAAGGAGGGDLALHPELMDRPRPAGAQGRRTRRGMHRRADPAAEAAGVRRSPAR